MQCIVVSSAVLNRSDGHGYSINLLNFLRSRINYSSIFRFLLFAPWPFLSRENAQGQYDVHGEFVTVGCNVTRQYAGPKPPAYVRVLLFIFVPSLAVSNDALPSEGTSINFAAIRSHVARLIFEKIFRWSFESSCLSRYSGVIVHRTVVSRIVEESLERKFSTSGNRPTWVLT